MEGYKNQFHKVLEDLLGLEGPVGPVGMVLGPDGKLEQSELAQGLTLMLWFLETRDNTQNKL